MNFDNGHRSRQGQHNNNKNRNRGRNNRRPGGGGGGNNSNNGGGNSLNRVYESNGPDVKVRGTAQTVAEKYLQLGRDAQSSGDNVMAESYFQFSEHYFRTWAAAQPVGQPTQQLRRPDDEEFEEERDDGVEAEADNAATAETTPVLAGEQVEGVNVNSGNSLQEGNGRAQSRSERFRPKWQNRRDQQAQDGQGDTETRSTESEAALEPRGGQVEPDVQGGEWEAPSFLRRPAPVGDEETSEPASEKRGRGRRPRVPVGEDEASQGE